MTLVETPGLLIWWKEQHYLEKFRDLFTSNNTIFLPENTSKPVIIYTNKDAPVLHLWRGGDYAWAQEHEFNFDDPRYYRRAQRILWIQCIVEKSVERKFFKDKKNGNICIVNFELEYTVVLKEAGSTFILITWFHTYEPYRYMMNTKRFEEIQTI